MRGPCTPSTRSSSMSLVADGPETNVSDRTGSSRSRAPVTATPTAILVGGHVGEGGADGPQDVVTGGHGRLLLSPGPFGLDRPGPQVGEHRGPGCPLLRLTVRSAGATAGW